MPISEISSRRDISTTNSTSIFSNTYLSNLMSQDDVANIKRMVEASRQEREEICRNKQKEYKTKYRTSIERNRDVVSQPDR